MAYIRVIGRREPIEVGDTLAREVKKAKWGTPEMAPTKQSSDLIDIGNWVGSYGEIKSVDFTQKTTEQKRRKRLVTQIAFTKA